MSKNYYLFYLCYVLSFFGSTQITIDNNTYTPAQLVDGVLIPSASGTVVSNISFGGVLNNSNRYQLGYFSTATSTLSDMGFSEGIVMSTGNTSDIPLALGTNPGSVAQIGTNFVSCTAGEIRKTGTCGTFVNDLNVLSGGANYYNAAILEFDFIPSNDFVQFRYVFGSEEYEDNGGFINYQCTEYNDRFGFLISGPGIAAGQGFDNDAENIATLANGSFVGINSVNNGVVGSSAVPNGSSFCQGVNPDWVQNSPSPEFGGIIDGTQLNGNTITLTAFRNNLIPGQTYHIKLLLTDVSDGTYDAVVYLEAGSFITQNSCSIMNITTGVQTPCDPATNTYTQEVILTYTNPPSTGNLVVNGQTFAIGTSPQTIVLTGLTSDGLGVDVTASFDADPICSLTELSLFTAPVDCTPTPCGISAITAGVQAPCDPATNTYTQEVTLTYTNPPSTGNLVVNGQTFAIGTSPQTIVLTGLTSDGLGVDVTASFDADPSCSLTELDLFTAPVDCTPTPCILDSIQFYAQSNCHPVTNTYDEELVIYYSNQPDSGYLIVNGQAFLIENSPQNILLTDLEADGGFVDVDIIVSSDSTALDTLCQLYVADFFEAAADCYLECGDFYVPEAFSPNGDGNNDVFTGRIFEECVKDFDLRIFNRWGEMIFHSESIYNAWDGTFKGKYAEEGVYVYKIELLLLEEFDPTLYSGNIQLIR
ncbi:MAG: choice-of-anchor L domain-containing protein [Crocinitomicaceae bacterium]|nr:choice-of-anchor L domain-containing protein [Crocinitomicaceae bacterium]